MNLFVTGTDTGVGKTTFCALLIRALRVRGIGAVGMKPIACGETNDDTLALVAASDGAVTAEEINPVWLRTPVSPFTASVLENRVIDTDAVVSAFRGLRARHEAVIVEGAGGWLVPIRPNYFVADLAVELDIPVVIVVENKLGALNHALLTLDHVQRRGLHCVGFVLNTRDATGGVATETNRSILETLTPVPVLTEITPGQTDLDAGSLLRRLQARC